MSSASKLLIQTLDHDAVDNGYRLQRFPSYSVDKGGPVKGLYVCLADLELFFLGVPNIIRIYINPF